jgi:2'-deoxynucleoside 5'-phosphate N-hydrolase
MKKMCKIYFGGSIRGGREDSGLYMRLVNHLRQYGEVLTEHVADAAVTKMGSSGTVSEIYEEDTSKILASDRAVFEVTTPSIGVGYEIAKTEGKKILCLYRPDADRSLSAMVSGNPNVTVRNYLRLEQALAHIDEFFAQ